MIRHKHRTILGPIPDEWGDKPVASFLADQLAGDWGEDSGDVDLPVLRSTNFTDSGNLDLTDVARRFFSSRNANAIQLRKDDILLERSGGGPDRPVGRVVAIREDMPSTGFANFVQCLRANREVVDPEFLLWLLFQLHRCGEVTRVQHQTTQMRNLDLRDYLRLILPYPTDPEEQTRIAATLKAADDHIRALEDQLHKAERVKRALLQSVFVCGPPEKHGPSQEFRWGVAPAGWSPTSVRKLLTEPVGNGISIQATKPEPPGTPTLNVSSIRHGRCDQSKLSYIELPEDLTRAFAVMKGDFFVLRGNGNRDYVAIGGLLQEEPVPGLVFSDLLIRLQFDTAKVDPNFMRYLWQAPSFLRRLQSYAITGSGLWKIGQRSISRFELALPELNEQTEIAALFDGTESLLGSLQTHLNAARRVKQSLLQNLLTGRLRLKP